MKMWQNVAKNPHSNGPGLFLSFSRRFMPAQKL